MYSSIQIITIMVPFSSQNTTVISISVSDIDFLTKVKVMELQHVPFGPGSLESTQDKWVN